MENDTVTELPDGLDPTVEDSWPVAVTVDKIVTAPSVLAVAEAKTPRKVATALWLGLVPDTVAV